MFITLKLFMQAASCTWKTYLMFVLTCGVDGFVMVSLNATHDLGIKGGMLEYYKDALFLSWGCLVLGTYSMNFFYILLVVPAFVAYQAWTSLIQPMLSSSGSNALPDGPPPNETPKERKRRLRMEKRAARRNRM